MTVNAEQRIIERFDEIEAALFDLKPMEFGIFESQQLTEDGLIQRRYRNRLMSAFLLLYHLKDDVKRLAKRRNLSRSIVDDFVDHSLWVKLCVRAGDTHKHGLGGRSKNATFPNGLLKVVKTRSGEKSSPSNEAIVIGMIIADADHGVFHSKSIIEGALRDWAGFLSAKFNLDLSNWIAHCIPAKPGPTIELRHDAHPYVPLGATLTMELPQDLQKAIVSDAVKRREES